MVRKPNTPPKKVFSYLRYSSKPQGKEGRDSERRQIERTAAWAKAHNLILDESLSMFARGVSAFRGRHRKEGALAAFLADVEAGKVPPGSLLVVEALDRISREGFGSALKNIIFKLWDHDITLQTIEPDMSYEPGCEDDPKFVGLWLYLSEAHKASVQKSFRINEVREAARQKAREHGRIVTGRCPAWLDPKWKLNKQSERIGVEGFTIQKKAKETIEAIFRWKLDGMGLHLIARKLNTGDYWQPPVTKGTEASGNVGWRESYISKLLANPATIGTYQPYHVWYEEKPDGEKVRHREPVGEPIPNYYPKVLDDDTIFYAMQAKLEANRGTGGRNDGHIGNLLRGLVKCGYCGRPMKYIQSGRPPQYWRYFRCDGARRGVGCTRQHRIQYAELEKLVIENCKHLKPQQILPTPDAQAKQIATLQQRIAGNGAKVRQLEKRLENLMDEMELENDAELRSAIKERMGKRREEIEALETQIAADTAERQKLETNTQALVRWQADLATLEKALESDDVPLRQRMLSHLRQLIERIEAYPRGFAAEYDGTKDKSPHRPPVGSPAWRKLSPEVQRQLRGPQYRDGFETVRDELADVWDEPDRKFADYVVKQRMGRRGRFYRIIFRTGFWIDVAPADSIASAMKLAQGPEGQAWKLVRPPYDALWQEYQAEGQKVANRV